VPLLEQVLEKYPGKVKLVFKNFPLRNHAQAKPAAIAALAAGEQGKFWEYHDKVFENYKSLSEEVLKRIAGEVGLDVKAFEAARKNPELAAAVSRDMQEGSRAGVRGTPTIFVNGRRLQQRSLQGFSQAIDRELKRLGGG
jgi:protein-disulfide isomerase